MRKVLIGAVAASALLLAGVAQADADLAKNSGCLNCHNVDTKLVGPSLKDIAAKYADQADASAYLADKIVKGSSGVWGPIPMPPNAAVSADNAKVLADFILTLK
ncbi:MAG: c-type cytochrome [Nitrosomonas sp.]|jgi:cytochrome c|uniref:c-type cytochrome n=1 Tax=Nitrosomonas sp. TaxID=42353 RepID=UPI0027283BBE|nr:c-type cytochrome [Nitrosomonas sp.]MDO8895542.1 c-type cytochrome [Nitrosomonas sp.]MDO9470830.1 c-type cytochrome [Nitrosomonas sp.]MDP1786854.1 c-type cytochrome [Nitrosomonas sp.]MDP2223910.1 c-type cytochrome [Nitrosomonas sp.]MDP3281262.1 c-type cytochrome [Nitrosomonas sp.]